MEEERAALVEQRRRAAQAQLQSRLAQRAQQGLGGPGGPTARGPVRPRPFPGHGAEGAGVGAEEEEDMGDADVGVEGAGTDALGAGQVREFVMGGVDQAERLGCDGMMWRALSLRIVVGCPGLTRGQWSARCFARVPLCVRRRRRGRALPLSTSGATLTRTTRSGRCIQAKTCWGRAWNCTVRAGQLCWGP